MQTIEADHMSLIKDLLAALSTGKPADAILLFTPNVVMNVPGRNSFAGAYRGRDEVVKLLVRLREWTGGSMRVRLHDVLANEQHGVVMYTVNATHQDRSIEYTYVDLYHFRDGQISEVWGTAPDLYAFDDFYSE